MKNAGIEKGIVNPRSKNSGLQIRWNEGLLMKKLFIGISFLLIIGCNPEKRLVDKSSRLIEKLQTTDTVYDCYAAFDDKWLIWYHDSTTLYGYIVKPYSTQKLPPVYCLNQMIDANSIDECFSTALVNNDPCFQSVLDGVGVSMYVKNQKERWCSVHTACLFSKEYPKNSFPYLLKQDLLLLNQAAKKKK